MPETSNDEAMRRRRACDACRRSKIKCNLTSSADAPCAHCTKFRLECTFVQEAQKRGPPKGYITALEARCKRLEQIIQRVAPNMDLEAEAGPSFTQDTWKVVAGANGDRVERPGSSSVTPRVDTVETSTPLSEQTDLKLLDVINELDDLKLSNGSSSRFHGQSSVIDFIQGTLNAGGSSASGTRGSAVRAKFWLPTAWKESGFFSSSAPVPTIVWPPRDLLNSLVTAYFDRMHPTFPIIDRRSFETGIKAGLHYTDVGFSRLTLLICAVATRFSDDPRTCMKDENGDIDWSSAGWKYFCQISEYSEPVFAPSNLYRLQGFVLACSYLQYIGAQYIGWILSGVGLRLAVDIGLHREMSYRTIDPWKAEMLKRTFWALVGIDILMSARLDRPTGIALEEIDVQLPREVDDDWYDPVSSDWHQPSNSLCIMTSFVQWVKLQQIVAREQKILRTNKEPRLSDLAKFDNTLLAWNAQLPPHLVWVDGLQASVYAQQACLLQLVYLATRISTYRPFLRPAASHELATPQAKVALETCVKCACDTVRVIRYLDGVVFRAIRVGGFAFNAAVMLIIGTWDLKRREPFNPVIAEYKADIDYCRKVLSHAELRWHTAGRLGDILEEMTSLDCVVPQRPKRNRTESDGGDHEPYAAKRAHIDTSVPQSASVAWTQAAGMGPTRNEPIVDATPYETGHLFDGNLMPDFFNFPGLDEPVFDDISFPQESWDTLLDSIAYLTQVEGVQIDQPPQDSADWNAVSGFRN